MTSLKIEAGEWIVVCDGAKALILENRGDAKFPNFATREAREQENPSTAAQGAQPPGRVHQSAGTARSSVEQTDWHDEAEKAFLAKLAGDLNAAAESASFTALTIVAPPRALGMLRPHFSKKTQAAITNEVAKDYVSRPLYQIEKLLTG
ncbi:MAG: host attachment protein [Alphaproteobacteria bacterium]|nr:host attachment protein [Alphaproteobacteria bacterium]